ncbi:hypothetical protein KP509_10G062600 [Ceratopteris richardii]|uniref:Uncharacterized protein n=1 Tax=Ceratopteris richardii TaxID=49495 RepID=A0A8T2TWH4_CERRI|nr:hypothetical protein KP509_10G062600 [Ceratopteris richardii]
MSEKDYCLQAANKPSHKFALPKDRQKAPYSALCTAGSARIAKVFLSVGNGHVVSPSLWFSSVSIQQPDHRNGDNLRMPERDTGKCAAARVTLFEVTVKTSKISPQPRKTAPSTGCLCLVPCRAAMQAQSFKSIYGTPIFEEHVRRRKTYKSLV